MTCRQVLVLQVVQSNLAYGTSGYHKLTITVIVRLFGSTLMAIYVVTWFPVARAMLRELGIWSIYNLKYQYINIGLIAK